MLDPWGLQQVGTEKVVEDFSLKKNVFRTLLNSLAWVTEETFFH